MATKALKQVGQLTNTSSGAACATISMVNFNAGDTANLNWGGTTIPVIVRSVFLTAQVTTGGDNALYTVETDITGNTPTVYHLGPVQVTADLLSTR